MPNENSYLLIKLDAFSKVIQAQPANHDFLLADQPIASKTTYLHDVLHSALHHYYLKQMHRINDAINFVSCPAQIININGIKYLVQLHFEFKLLTRKEKQLFLYFNYIEIESFSKSRQSLNNFSEDRATKIQLASAFEQIRLLIEDNQHSHNTEDKLIFKGL